MLTKEQKGVIIAQNRIHLTDTGSSVVQIEIISARIRDLRAHFDTHKKDKHSRRGMIKMVFKRRKLLAYLKRTDNDAYLNILKMSKAQGT
jgi:small subunit ribosomal protein S15